MTESAARRVWARIWRRLRGTRQSPARVALAVWLGLFIGCLPVYGLHFVLCGLVCLPLGLDLVLCYLVANISNPFVAPFLVTLEVELGSLVTSGKHAAFSLARARQTGVLGFLWQAAVGSVFVGSGLGAIGSGIAYAVSSTRRAAPEPMLADTEEIWESALLRTVERYRDAPLGDRLYVAAKLRWDPLTRLLATLPGELGRVLDAGAGRGQFGLFLWELGRCSELRGCDSDARKVALAARAGGSDARFDVQDLLALCATADTVVLADVLHYLPLNEQDEVLRRLASSMPRGRILIRDLDASPKPRSAVTRAFEWLAKISGYNRGRSGRYYRPAKELTAQLESAGFSCEVLGASEGTPFANVLIVATKSLSSMRSSSGSA
jgi:uncharacterized protein (DUF2062 family)/2-polyprenyl-3-methyl-5-hydroxy-6-metoxy-1,4-benzoquinol methylase